MQATEHAATRPPLGIAFEGDLDSRFDAVLALAMLNGLTANDEARRIALSISGSSLATAQFADVLAEFYPSLPALVTPTIGMPDGVPRGEDASALAELFSEKAADGRLLFSSNIRRLVDAADSAVLVRNMLLAQYDQNASIVLAGPATGLARLLELHAAPAQIAAKVRCLVIAAGTFPAGRAEPALRCDVAAARKLFAGWPTPVIAVGSEVGEALPYPASSIDTELGWSPAHPVAHAYRIFKSGPYASRAKSMSTTALAAMLQAVRPEAGYFQLSEPGTISVLDDGQTRFTPGAGGMHRYLIVDPAQRDRVVSVYTALVSAVPAPRPVRGPRPAAPDAVPGKAP
jgi:hypothetical protein